jgi:hypothetical protein
MLLWILLAIQWVIWGGIWDNIFNPFTIFYNRYTGIGIKENSAFFVAWQQVPNLKLSSNPFQENLKMTFYMPETYSTSNPSTQTKLDVYDPSGALVITLYDGPFSIGYTCINWDGRNALGNKAPNGVYLIRLTLPQNSLTKKVLKLR